MKKARPVRATLPCATAFAFLASLPDCFGLRGADRSPHQARAGPRLDDLQGWLQQTLATVSQKSALAIAILRAVIERIAEHPINRIDELVPWNLASAPAAELREAA